MTTTDVEGARPCRCGSTKLRVHRYHMGAGANLWCDGCGAGTPSGKDADLAQLVHHEHGPIETSAIEGSPVRLARAPDATPGAIEKWNRWAAAGQAGE